MEKELESDKLSPNYTMYTLIFLNPFVLGLARFGRAHSGSFLGRFNFILDVAHTQKLLKLQTLTF